MIRGSTLVLPRPLVKTCHILLLVCIAASSGLATAESPGGTKQQQPQISKAAAGSCDAKVKALEAFAANPAKGKNQVTRFTEQEVNSYLALELSSKFSPSLKSLVLGFEESKLKGVAEINFDQLGTNSSTILSRLLAGMFSGIHNLTVTGKLIARSGKGNFELDEARFDGTTLPKLLVEQIITAVGKRQKPPFDPMQPSTLPYLIDRVDVHTGYIVVYQ